MEKRTALFVDDEEKILRALKRGLREEPYNTLFTKSGHEALEILRQNEVHVLVTDMRMPEMSGLELFEIVKKEYPDTVIMALSGQPQVQQAEISALVKAFNQGEIFKIIAKPWDLEEVLKIAVRQAIDYYDLHNERDSLATELEQCKAKLGEEMPPESGE